jgi:hypothetical protein
MKKRIAIIVVVAVVLLTPVSYEAAVPVLLQLIATPDKDMAPKACLALAQSAGE